ncbi:MAG: tetratricopeptide repeat protein [Vampirovibrionales bacterium]
MPLPLPARLRHRTDALIHNTLLGLLLLCLWGFTSHIPTFAMRSATAVTTHESTCKTWFKSGRGQDNDLSMLKRCSDWGHAPSQVELAKLYLYSPYEDRNIEKGLKLLFEASKTESPKALLEMGKVYAEGEVVPQDMLEAVRWLRLAALYNQGEAQYYIALCYKEGFCQEQRKAHLVTPSSTTPSHTSQPRKKNNTKPKNTVLSELLNDRSRFQLEQSNIRAYAWAKLAYENGTTLGGYIMRQLDKVFKPQDYLDAERTYQSIRKRLHLSG